MDQSVSKELLPKENLLGSYLRDRREKLDPAALGFSHTRRRTPGLRREEVAQLAHISPTWYTWLEQGRGGAPSSEVLERIGRALMLTELEREHLFLLALGRPPEARYRERDAVTPRLQRVLDALEPCPALIRTATWDVVAWNRGVGVMMKDYGSMPARDRNILRYFFLDPMARIHHDDWPSVARFVVGAFRLDVERAGAAEAVEPLVEDLRRLSPEFASFWSENAVHTHSEAVKRMKHPVLGEIEFEYSAFAVDGRPDLTMAVHHPVSAVDAARLAALIEERVADSA